MEEGQMEVTINYNGQAVAVEVTLDVYKRQVYKCALVNKGLMAYPRILAGLQSIPQPPEDRTGQSEML